MRVRLGCWLAVLLLAGCGGGSASSRVATPSSGGAPVVVDAAGEASPRVGPLGSSDAGALREALAGLAAVGDEVHRVQSSLAGLDRQADELADSFGRAARRVGGAEDPAAAEERVQRLAELSERWDDLRSGRASAAERLALLDGQVRSVSDYLRDLPAGHPEDVDWVRGRAQRHAGELRVLDAEIDGLRRGLGLLARDADGLVEPGDPQGVVAASEVERSPAAETSVPRPSSDLVALVTSEGALLIELYDEVAPRNAAHFRRLVESGFYDGLTFHRIFSDDFVQGGCPLGTGAGGAGREVRAEFSALPHRWGTVSMARMAHPDTASSQFFITLRRLPNLDGKYTVIGQVVDGDDVLAALAARGTPSGRPAEPVPLLEQASLHPRRDGILTAVRER